MADAWSTGLGPFTASSPGAYGLRPRRRARCQGARTAPARSHRGGPHGVWPSRNTSPTLAHMVPARWVQTLALPGSGSQHPRGCDPESRRAAHRTPLVATSEHSRLILFGGTGEFGSLSDDSNHRRGGEPRKPAGPASHPARTALASDVPPETAAPRRFPR